MFHSQSAMLRNVKCFSTKKSPACVDCRYFRPQFEHYHVEDRLKNGLCTHPKVTDVDLITGDHKYKAASIVRHNKDQCGTQGEYFCSHDTVLLVLRMIRCHIRFKNIMEFIGQLAFFLFCSSLILLSATLRRGPS